MKDFDLRISSPIFLRAAYGRSYPTKEAAIRAWEEGKDFGMLNSTMKFFTYCSIRDFEDLKQEYPSGIYLLYGKHPVEECIKIY
jgi:hypothetical protein